ncbi:MAG: hypothetical protein JWN09_326 [Microbacteriaceae bacterium]|jgi:hypothetical protein|nr:hypothetical protein [Microbacteriaceae bacterium]
MINAARSTHSVWARYVPMEVEEADQIVTQFNAGSLDPDMIGTMALVNEARRVQVDAYMWGTVKHHPRRRVIRRLILAEIVLLLSTIVGLSLPFLAAIH